MCNVKTLTQPYDVPGQVEVRAHVVRELAHHQTGLETQQRRTDDDADASGDFRGGHRLVQQPQAQRQQGCATQRHGGLEQKQYYGLDHVKRDVRLLYLGTV